MNSKTLSSQVDPEAHSVTSVVLKNPSECLRSLRTGLTIGVPALVRRGRLNALFIIRYAEDLWAREQVSLT